MGKGSKRRPLKTLTEENNLRWELAEGKITEAEYNRRYAKLKREGKIKRL